MSYHYEHVLTNSDVEKVNNTLSLIESSRTDSIPKQGDIIEYTNKYGEYYKNGHIENQQNDSIYICEKPYVPFVETSNTRVSTSTSGGHGTSFQQNSYDMLGKEKRPSKYGDIVAVLKMEQFHSLLKYQCGNL